MTKKVSSKRIAIISINNRNWNQDKIDDNFLRIRDFLHSNDLQVNDAKTNLTEFMTHQKR